MIHSSHWMSLSGSVSPMELHGHITSAPYHHLLIVMKKSLKSTVNESGTIQTKLSRFLMSNHSIPLTTTEETPADLLLQQPIRTRLDLLKPNLEDKVTQKQESLKRFHVNAEHKMREFILGQDVLVKN